MVRTKCTRQTKKMKNSWYFKNLSLLWRFDTKLLQLLSDTMFQLGFVNFFCSLSHSLWFHRAIGTGKYLKHKLHEITADGSLREWQKHHSSKTKYYQENYTFRMFFSRFACFECANQNLWVIKSDRMRSYTILWIKSIRHQKFRSFISVDWLIRLSSLLIQPAGVFLFDTNTHIRPAPTQKERKGKRKKNTYWSMYEWMSA